MKLFSFHCRCCLGVLLISCGLACAQQLAVTAKVSLPNAGKKGRGRDASNVVIWLTPADSSALAAVADSQSSVRPRLIQKNKSFDPHVLVVSVGSVVEFPNRDPFFHNVFSLFEGKRFDLGLYEAGSTRYLHFDRPGVSYIFCNIHAEMSAVVIALETPYFAISDRHGDVVIPDVPAGRYTMHIWYEAALPETLNSLTKGITVSESNATLGVLRLPVPRVAETHKNMYGGDYAPPTPASPSPAYERP